MAAGTSTDGLLG
jgi:alpha-tubulin suppressor-like RCC1 family protein